MEVGEKGRGEEMGVEEVGIAVEVEEEEEEEEKGEGGEEEGMMEAAYESSSARSSLES